MRTAVLGVLFFAWMPAAWSQQHLPQHYEITQLSVPGSSQTTPIALNDVQQAAISWTNANHTLRAGIYDLRTGAMTDLGTLGGSESTPTDINNAGQVVGYSANGSGWWNAFVWSNGTLRNLGTLPGGITSGAYAINDSGDIVGWSVATQNPQSPLYATRFTGSGAISIGTPESYAFDVNSFGVATGFAPSSVTGVRHAVIFRNGAVIDLAVPDRPGTLSFGVAINDSEYVAGYYTDRWADLQRSFIVSANGSMTDLGTLPGYDATQSYAMNNYGMVVGGVSNGPFIPHSRAFVYGDCRIVDLTNMIDPASRLKPYVTLTTGRDINNSGWIIASGTDTRDPGRSPRAYLLKPVGPPSNICT